MFKSIHLKNFRKHEDKAIQFSEGLNVIRGSNEVGKSTLYEGMLYALYGATALRESLSGVVTYGKQESDLWVKVEFVVEGVDYIAERSTRGAEIRWADEVVTGQSATRAFVENLLGCQLKVAQQLMFAKQSAVKGVLTVNGEANALVERLANLNQIENIIEAIQHTLPSGSLVGIDQQIATLEAQQQNLPVKPEKVKIDQINEEIKENQEKFDLLKRSLPSEVEVSKAKVLVEESKQFESLLDSFLTKSGNLKAVIERNLPVCSYSQEDLDSLRQLAASDELEATRLKSYNKVFPTCSDVWEGSLDSLKREITRLSMEYDNFSEVVSEREKQLAFAKGRIIHENSCGFCGKDLSEISEVVYNNEKAKDQIEVLTRNLMSLRQDLVVLKGQSKILKEIARVSETVLQMVDDNYTWDENEQPPTPKWKGSIPSIGGAKQELAKAEQDMLRLQRAILERDNAQRELDSLKEPTPVDATEANSLLVRVFEVEEDMWKAETRFGHLQLELAQEQGMYEGELRAYETGLKAFEDTKKLLLQVEAQRSAMICHNELIKKLRKARPQIAAKMWGSVQGAISHYFTSIRGEDSVVERTADGFTVNGRDIQGLSGSTEDILGLSIRMALTKLFIPWVPALMLDESFSACDTQRELAGVAALASAGFGQVILVTHSDAPESLADNLIEL